MTKLRIMSNSSPLHWVSLLMSDKEGQVEKVQHNLNKGDYPAQIRSIYSSYSGFSEGGGDIALIVNNSDFSLIRGGMSINNNFSQPDPFHFLDIDGDKVYQSPSVERGKVDVYVKLAGVLKIPSYVRTKGVSRQDIILINTVLDFVEKAIAHKGIKEGLSHCRKRWNLTKN